jgi:hypothetical protein
MPLFGGLFLGMAVRAVASALTNRVMDNTMGRIVPEVVNIGRKIIAKQDTGDSANYTPVESERATFKGSRTIIGGVVLALLKMMEIQGCYLAPDWVYETVVGIMTGTLALHKRG